MPKWLVGLLIAAGILLAAAVVIHLPRKSPEPQLPAVAADKIRKIEIQHPYQRIVLEKDDGRWYLTDPIKYPANEANVTSVLSSLGSLTVGGILTERPESYGTYNITDSSGVTVQTWEDPAKAPSVWVFGKMAQDRLRIYLRLPPGPAVYSALGVELKNLEKFSSEWREKRVLLLEEGEDVVGWKVKKTGAKFEIVRSSDHWLMDGRLVDGPAVAQALQSLKTLIADDFIDPPNSARLKELGLAPPQAVHTLKLSSGRTVEIKVGAPNKGRQQTPLQRGLEWSLFWVEDATLAGLPATAKDLKTENK